MLDSKDFEILKEYLLCGTQAQEALAGGRGARSGTADARIQKLRASGFIDDDGITAAGRRAMEPYRVAGAVIMAAGMASRFAPISYTQPKGLLTVRGEVLIERQIKQLKAAGIERVTVVVGYLKEQFSYLEDKFGVDLLVNPHFETRNNNSTIMVARELLENSYICSSDNYFTVNPFEQYVYEAYYAAVYQAGETNEYCLHTEGESDRIVGVDIGGHDAWVMLGHAYWDRRYAQNYLRMLDAVYDDPATASKLWEDLYIEHIDELPMVMRRYERDVIFEFDTLDELLAFDPAFAERLDSNTLKSSQSLCEG